MSIVQSIVQFHNSKVFKRNPLQNYTGWTFNSFSRSQPEPQKKERPSIIDTDDEDWTLELWSRLFSFWLQNCLFLCYARMTFRHIKLYDFKLDLIEWQLNFVSCNFGLKSDLWVESTRVSSDQIALLLGFPVTILSDECAGDNGSRHKT